MPPTSSFSPGGCLPMSWRIKAVTLTPNNLWIFVLFPNLCAHCLCLGWSDIFNGMKLCDSWPHKKELSHCILQHLQGSLFSRNKVKHLYFHWELWTLHFIWNCVHYAPLCLYTGVGRFFPHSLPLRYRRELKVHIIEDKTGKTLVKCLSCYY